MFTTAVGHHALMACRTTFNVLASSWFDNAQRTGKPTRYKSSGLLLKQDILHILVLLTISELICYDDGCELKPILVGVMGTVKAD